MNSIAIFITLLAVIVRLIQTCVPSTEVYFVSYVSAFCLLFGAAVSDPETFFGLLFSIVPILKKCFPSVEKSIECLREGKERLDSLNKDRKKASSNEDDELISFKTLLSEVRKRIQWRFITRSIICGICIKFIAYEKPKVIGQMLDSVVREDASMNTSFWPHFRPLILFIILDYILLSLKEYYKYGAVHRFHKDAKTDMIENILNQDEDFIHEERHSAGFTHLMNVECNRMQKIVNESLTHMSFGLVTTLFAVRSLAQVDKRLTLMGLFFKSPLVAMLQKLSRKDIVKYGRLYDASQGAAHRVATSILSPGVIHLLQANVAQRKGIQWYLEKQESFIRYLENTHFRQTMLCLVRHGLNNCEDVLLLAMGMACVLEKTITIGMYFTFRSHLVLLDQGLKEIFDLLNEIMTIRMSSKVFFELLYRKSKIGSTHGCISEIENNTELTLSLRNVSFSYQMNPSLKVLDGINLSLRPGKIVALIGESGGGKSTTTRLIQRFYDATEGRIELNNVDIRDIDLNLLRRYIRVIDQDPVLPDLTIYENIALGIDESDMSGDKTSTRDRVIEAAKLADAHRFITTKCENGYDTPVRFIYRLSGGERQRIAIARALASRASIIICDEITSSLDAETEKTVMTTLSQILTDKAVLVIAHRLSTIRHADEIIFLEKGRIVERGTHEELVRLNGRYSCYAKTLNQH